VRYLYFFILFSVIPFYVFGQDYYEQNPKLKDTRIVAVLPKSEGLGNSINESSLPVFIQGILTENFTRFSPMTVINRQQQDAAIKEQGLSETGFYDEKGAPEIGRLLTAKSLITCTIIKTDQNRFSLQFSVIDANTSTNIAAWTVRNASASHIKNGLVLNEACFHLLTDMGVKLTESGKNELSGTLATKTMNSQTALANGIVAERSGASLIEAMQYYYQAVDYNENMEEILGRLNNVSQIIHNLTTQPIMANTNVRESASALARNKIIDEQNKQIWIKQLTDCENYFADFFKTTNFPFFLVCSTDIKFGEPDVNNNTIPLMFETQRLCPDASWVNAVQNTVNTVRKSLLATGRAEDWGLSNWPTKNISSSSPFKGKKQKIAITASLQDMDKQRTIAKKDFDLTIGWDCTIRNKELSITLLCDQKPQDISFTPLRINILPERIGIAITQINNEDAKIAIENGLLMVSAQQDYEDVDGCSYDEIMKFNLDFDFGNDGNIRKYKGNEDEVEILRRRINGELITSIGSSAFEGKKIKEVIIPASVEIIGKSAFANNLLTTLTLPPSIKTINNNAFTDNQLVNINIPASVEAIGNDAFSNNLLTTLMLSSGIKTIGENAFTKNQLAKINIPVSVEVIGEDAFGNNLLTTLTLPPGIKTIGKNAFCNNHLARIDIPASVEAIGMLAFYNNLLTTLGRVHTTRN
jgi:hypothetical protein